MIDPTDQHLNELTKKIIGETSLEQPSLDFTTNVMAQVEMTSEKIIAYKPLISKKGWLAIVALFFMGIVFAFYGDFNGNGWFDSINLDYSVLTDNKFTELISSITLSSTAIYAIVFFGLLFFVQISYLKNYHSKQLKY